MWVIVNWWVWPVPDFHFRKLEAMNYMHSCNLSCLFILSLLAKGRNIFIQKDHDSDYKKFTLEFGCSGFGKKRIEIL